MSTTTQVERRFRFLIRRSISGCIRRSASFHACGPPFCCMWSSNRFFILAILSSTAASRFRCCFMKLELPDSRRIMASILVRSMPSIPALSVADTMSADAEVDVATSFELDTCTLCSSLASSCLLSVIVGDYGDRSF